RRHTRFSRDWSADVCSSDLLELAQKFCDQARKLDEKNAEADYLSGVIYQRWQRPETSLAYYTSATEKAPSELPYLMARSEMLVRSEERRVGKDRRAGTSGSR